MRDIETIKEIARKLHAAKELLREASKLASTIKDAEFEWDAMTIDGHYEDVSHTLIDVAGLAYMEV